MVYGHFGIGIVLFVFFLTIDVILYAFNAAIRTLSPNDIAESKEGKAKYREMISKILESPSRFNDTVNIIVYITNIMPEVTYWVPWQGELFSLSTQTKRGYILYLQLP